MTILGIELSDRALFGGGFAALLSFSGLILTSIWTSGGAINKARVETLAMAEAKHHEELAELKKELTQKMKEQDERHGAEIQRIHEALAGLIALIPPERASEAMAIVVRLGVQPVIHPASQPEQTE